MGLINELGAGFSPRKFRAVLLLTLGICVFMFGCKASPTWSAESRSPNGKMIATADAFANGGFAAPGPGATFVYLNWATGSQPKMLILALSEGQPESDAMKVEMNWLAPKHLELTYKGQRTIDFQAVKYAGVDISVREVGNQAHATDATDQKNELRSLPTPPAFAYQKSASPQSGH